MKKKITLLALIVVVMSTAIFAKPLDVTVSSNVLNSFSTKFNAAKEVAWSSTDTYVKASFKMNDQYMFAYFTESGEFIGVSRNLLSSQLPFNLQAELRKVSGQGWITELFEFANDAETSYFVTVENADQKLQLKSIGVNSWSVYKKVKKG